MTNSQLTTALRSYRTLIMKFIFSLILSCVLFTVVNAQPDTVEVSNEAKVSNRTSDPVDIPKVETSPVIDGFVDEEIWKTAKKFELNFQTYPGENTPPTNKTETFLMYDDEYIYVAFKCWDIREKIRATVAKRG
ncbi:MAG: hypothetical protein R2681_04590 [Pyrinomonadaceae bacterium]